MNALKYSPTYLGILLNFIFAGLFDSHYSPLRLQGAIGPSSCSRGRRVRLCSYGHCHVLGLHGFDPGHGGLTSCCGVGGAIETEHL